MKPHARIRLFALVSTVFILATSLLAATVTHAQSTSPNTSAAPLASSGKINAAYFTQWGIYQRNYLVKNIVTSGTASKLNALMYAFANISSSYQCASGDAYADYQKTFTADQAVNGTADTWNQPLAGNFNQLKELKALYPNIKIFISIGGWTWSTNFSAAASSQNLSSFVHSCIDQYILGNQAGPGTMAGIFDGIDIDWEYPNDPGNGNPHGPQDTQNYTNLLKEFRTQLDQAGAQTGKHYLLTVAAPAGQDKYANIQLNQIGQYLDWIDIMTYDMHGAWNATGPTDFNAPLYADPADPSAPPANSYSIDHAVTDYLAAGVPASKVVIGMPIYGRGWTNVPNTNNGLYQSSSSMQAAPGTYEAGIEDYKVLKNLTGYTTYRNSVTKTSWVYNGSTFWNYDDPTTIATKMSYINSKGLGGAFSWSLDGDDASGSFVNAVSAGLGTSGGGSTPTPVPTNTPTPTPTKTPTPIPTNTPTPTPTKTPTPIPTSTPTPLPTSTPTPTSTPVAGNLVTNPGFESGTLSGWTCDTNDKIVSTPVHAGTHALQ
ncbi:MAG TPA: glycosyl hydrolase family 18 protein, partial [Ktedonobacteraceae bacterium]